MLTINIAAVVVVKIGGLESHNLQQMYDIYGFIKVLDISGSLPITFAFFTLHLISMVSRYVLASSICSIVSSIVILMTVENFDPNAPDLSELASSYS